MFGNWLVAMAEALAFTGAEDVDTATPEQMTQAWALVGTTAEMSPAELAAGIATQSELGIADFGARERHATALVPSEVAHRRNVFPLRCDDTHIWIATGNPLSQDARRELRELTGRTIVFEVAAPDSIMQRIDLGYGPLTAEERELSAALAQATNEPTGPHILVVDDEVGQRTLLRSILEEAGFRVGLASDGPSAVELMMEDPTFDLVTLDYWLDKMNGLRVLQHIRAHRSPDISDIPVIMVTGADDRQIEMSLFEAGTDDFVTKPIDAPLFVLWVRAVLRRRRYR